LCVTEEKGQLLVLHASDHQSLTIAII
jgi:hypothetical protein